MPILFPMVHMISELFEFFTKILSAPFETKLSDLLQDLPNAEIILNILNVNKKEMNMTLGELFKQQMNMPNSFLQKQFNFIFNLRFLYEEITKNNSIILQLMLKEERDNYFAELTLEYIIKMAMLYDSLDLLSEQERLAQIQKMIDAYLDQLNSYFEHMSHLSALHDDLSSIREQLQEAHHELNNTAEKDFTNLANIFKDNQQSLVNDLTTQLQQIDNQINIQTEKLTRAENDLVAMQARNDPANVLAEKTTEINNLKSSISSLEDLRTDVSNLLSSAQNNLKEATQISQGGIASWGTPSGDNVTKLAALKTTFQSLNKETLSEIKNIQTKEDFLRETHSTVLDQSFKRAQTYENAHAGVAEFSKSIAESDKGLDALLIKTKILQEKEQEKQKEIENVKKDNEPAEAYLKKHTPKVQEILKQAGKNDLADQLHHFANFSKLQPAIPTPAKKEKSWNPSSPSQAPESYMKAVQKSSQNRKDINDNNPPKPPEPPKNNFHHK